MVVSVLAVVWRWAVGGCTCSSSSRSAVSPVKTSCGVTGNDIQHAPVLSDTPATEPAAWYKIHVPTVCETRRKRAISTSGGEEMISIGENSNEGASGLAVVALVVHGSTATPPNYTAMTFIALENP